MSYDLVVAAHDRPALDEVEAWAAEEGLDAERTDAQVVVRRSGRVLLTVDAPLEAEPGDLPEALAAAVLAPRWLVELGVTGPQRAVPLGRALARRLAEACGGAAYDAQRDALVWPRGRRRRVAARRGEEPVTLVTLEWAFPAARWADVPAGLLEALARRLPEALPRRFGRFEPPQERFEDPAAFVRFVLDDEQDDGFWFAARPCFGGAWRAPYGPRPCGTVKVDLDGGVLREDVRWREAAVDLLVAVAGLGAVFAVARTEEGWFASSANRLSIRADALDDLPGPLLSAEGWPGLPPEPAWLAWFGPAYRELVAPHLPDAAPAGDGLLLRVADEPRTAELPLPAELVRNGDDPAATLPPLT